MGALLKEDGTYLLQEDGISKIILQPVQYTSQTTVITLGNLLQENGGKILQENGSKIQITGNQTGGLSASLSFMGALRRARVAKLFGSLSFKGTLNKNTNKKIGGSLSFVSKLTKKTSKKLNGSLSFSGAFTKTKISTPTPPVLQTTLHIPANLVNSVTINAYIESLHIETANLVNTINISASFNLGTGTGGG